MYHSLALVRAWLTSRACGQQGKAGHTTSFTVILDTPNIQHSNGRRRYRRQLFPLFASCSC